MNFRYTTASTTPTIRTQYPSDVFLSFLSNTETLIKVLCDHSGIRRTALDVPNFPTARSDMTGPEWPQAPELPGRPLDTALLLNRDYTSQIRDRIQNDPNQHGLPINVWRPFSQNMETMIRALCYPGNIQLNLVNTIPRIQDANNHAREQRGGTRSSRRETANRVEAPWDGHPLVKVEEPSSSGSENSDSNADSTTDTLEGGSGVNEGRPGLAEERRHGAVKDELDAATDSKESKNSSTDSGTEAVADNSPARFAFAPFSSPPPIPPPKSAFRRTRKVSVKLPDAEVRMKLRKLTRSQILNRIRSSIREQQLNVTVDTCDKLGKSVHIRLWTKDAEG
ncbi:MAG: hypothetical protein Q9166_006277 [cf. Caloplaca sp. 2 TL-2023]